MDDELFFCFSSSTTEPKVYSDCVNAHETLFTVLNPAMANETYESAIELSPDNAPVAIEPQETAVHEPSTHLRIQNITALPPELLVIIFHFVPPDAVFDFESRTTESSRVNISHVCRKWRAVALQCPSLWCHIPVVNARLARAMLKRAQTLPLHFIGEARYKDDELRHIIRANLHNTETLDIHGDLSVVTFLTSKLGSSAPNLRKLYVCDYEPVDEEEVYSANLVKIIQNSPRLESVKLSTFSFPWTAEMSNLRSLELFVPQPGEEEDMELPDRRYSLDDILEGLSKMHQLENLELHHYIPYSSVFHGRECITLPRLRRIYLFGFLASWFSLWQYLSTPAIELSSLICVGNESEIRPIIFCKFTDYLKSKLALPGSATFTHMRIQHRRPYDFTTRIYLSSNARRPETMQTNDASKPDLNPQKLFLTIPLGLFYKGSADLVHFFAQSLPSQLESLKIIGFPKKFSHFRELLTQNTKLRRIELNGPPPSFINKLCDTLCDTLGTDNLTDNDPTSTSDANADPGTEVQYFLQNLESIVIRAFKFNMLIRTGSSTIDLEEKLVLALQRRKVLNAEVRELSLQGCTVKPNFRRRLDGIVSVVKCKECRETDTQLVREVFTDDSDADEAFTSYVHDASD